MSSEITFKSGMIPGGCYWDVFVKTQRIGKITKMADTDVHTFTADTYCTEANQAIGCEQAATMQRRAEAKASRYAEKYGARK